MAEASLSIKTSCRVDDSFVSSGKCNVRMICLLPIGVINPYFDTQGCCYSIINFSKKKLLLVFNKLFNVVVSQSESYP